MRGLPFNFNGAGRLMMTAVNSADFQLEKLKAQYWVHTTLYISFQFLFLLEEEKDCGNSVDLQLADLFYEDFNGAL